LKELTDKQIKALELLTSGRGLTYTAVAAEVGVTRKTIYQWLNDTQNVTFQQELERINNERWKAIADAARASALRLIEKDNQKMVEFVLKNEGYNPCTKVEAELHNDINIIIEE
jgi:transposase